MALKSVGANLREAREKQGFSLDEISARTRITGKCLTAIEGDDVSKLSSPFFYKSFVRQYAEQVGLDFQQLSVGVDQLASTMREPDLPGQGEYQPVRVAAIQPRIKRDFSWMYSVLLFIGTVAAISSGYAAWRYQPIWLTSSPVGAFMRSLKSSQEPSTTSTSQIWQKNSSEPVADPKQPASDAAPADAKTGPSATDATVVAQSSAPVNDKDSPKDSKTSDSAEGPGVTAVIVPEDASRADAGIHLEVSATERTWLSVTADGKPAYSGILEKEEVKVLDGQETAQLRTGNAAGVSITFNGKPIGSIGPRGTTRTVVFTKTSFEVIQQPNHPQLSRMTRIGG